MLERQSSAEQTDALTVLGATIGLHARDCSVQAMKKEQITDRPVLRRPATQGQVKPQGPIAARAGLRERTARRLEAGPSLPSRWPRSQGYVLLPGWGSVAT